MLASAIGGYGQRAGERPVPILVDEIGSMRLPKRKPVSASERPSIPRSAGIVKTYERSAFEQMNAERAAMGLSRLEWSDELADLARWHSHDMAERKYFSHRSKDGTTVDGRADVLGIGGWRAIGGNIAFLRGYDDPVAMAIQNWLLSPSHRKNMLSGVWRESAIGVAVSDDGAVYFTQVFLTRK